MTPVGHYRTEGWARLGPLLAEPALEALRARADALMLGEVRHAGMFFQHDSGTGRYEDLPYGKGWIGPSLAYRKLEKLELDPLFLSSVIEAPALEPYVRAVIPGEVVIYRAVLMNKPAEAGTPLPWHQDGGRFWGLDRDPELQIWIALDDAPLEAGPVEVFPRSHTSGLATPLGGIVPPDHVERRAPDALPLPARAGEGLLIHNHVWHRSGVNRTPYPRRAVSVCYMDAATRCLRKKHAPRSFFPVFSAAR